MTLSEFTTAVPDAKRVSLNRRDPAHRTVVMPSKDRFIQRVEYHFHHGRRRELAIYYTSGKVPGGFERLRARLQETYGEPAVMEQTEEYSAGLNFVSIKKTVWKDRATQSVLAQSHKMYDDGRESYDLILTITDFDLQQMFEQEQRQRQHQEELKVPIPLPDPGYKTSRQRCLM